MLKRIEMIQWTLSLLVVMSLLLGCHLHRKEPAFDPKMPDAGYFTPLHALQSMNNEHKATDSCDNCHVKESLKTARQFNKPIPQICYDCHEDYSASGKNLHGPVAVGACLSCHEPHFSTYIHLQRTEQPKLCLRCHQTGKTYDPQNHPDTTDRLCTQCHDPHASSRKMMLKE